MSARTDGPIVAPRWLVIALVIVLIAIAADRLLMPRPVTDETRSRQAQKLDMITQAMQMYVVDFRALPPSNEPAQVRRLLLAYAYPQDFLQEDGRTQLAIAYAFPPGKARDEIGDWARLKFAEITLGKSDRIISYLDAHLDILRPGQAPVQIPSWRERREGRR